MYSIFLTFFLFISPINAAVPFSVKDPGVAFQGYRILSLAPSGAADIGECFMLMDTIKENDDGSWFKEWSKLANKLEQEAAASSAKGHMQSATSAYFRAANYYKAAQTSIRGNQRDPRVIMTWQKFTNCFKKAIQALPTPIINVEIPFENNNLKGLLCLPDTDSIPRPLLIIQPGLDGSAEELFWMYGKAAVERGYVCLIVEGPGQGSLIVEQNLPLRYNWETVVTPIVDFAYELPWVNKEKIAILGVGFGGYLVPRALAFEKRIQVGIVNGGIYDFYTLFAGGDSANVKEGLESIDQKKDFERHIFDQMKQCQSFRWTYENALFCFEAKTPSELMSKLQHYTLKDCAHMIGAHMLIVDSDRDAATQGQSKALYDALLCSKEYLLFSTDEGAGYRCQIGAQCLSCERIFNWLDTNLKRR